MPLTGSSREIPLVDVVQVGAGNRQTCRIAVRGPTVDGELYLDHGELVHATCGGLLGEEAALRLLGAREVLYRVESEVVSDVRTIDAAVHHLLLESARRLDEAARRSPALDTGPVAVPVLDRPRWQRIAVAASAALLTAAVVVAIARRADRAPAASSGVAAELLGATAAEALDWPPVDATALTGPGDARRRR